MKTSLNLLTREGAIVVTFDAVLTPSQYARLFECVQEPISKAEMKACIEQVADEAGIAVAFDRELAGAHSPRQAPPPASARLKGVASLPWRCSVIESNGEVANAVAALTTEVMKLTALDGDAKAVLTVTIENAFSRLAIAILAQSRQSQEKSLEDALVAS